MAKLVIIEDDAVLARGLEIALAERFKEIQIAPSSSMAEKMVAKGLPDLVLLDLNLPDEDGLVLCRRLREIDPEMGIIMLTARDLETDVVAGLIQGADDYLTKPASLAVLRARVDALLRRIVVRKESRYVFEKFEFDFLRNHFAVAGELVALSPTEVSLLRYFILNRRLLISKEQLADHLWHGVADDNTVSVAVGRLRRKLKAESVLLTRYGMGYEWCG